MTTTARIGTMVLALLAIAGCGIREKREEIKNIGGNEYVCTWTHNNLSGNESEYTCFPVEVQP